MYLIFTDYFWKFYRD